MEEPFQEYLLIQDMNPFSCICVKYVPNSFMIYLLALTVLTSNKAGISKTVHEIIASALGKKLPTYRLPLGRGTIWEVIFIWFRTFEIF